jgi:5,10-methylenetetrahydromethanopterin reductase
VPELVAAAVRAEQLGYDTVVVPDSQLLWRDTWAVLVATAMATDRVGLATEVSNVATRDRSVVASAVRTVAELAPGRLRLGLGVGNSAVGLAGLRASSTEALGAAVKEIRALLDGAGVPLAGGVEGVEFARLQDPGGAVPIVLGVEGPRGLALAGRCADGVVLSSHSAQGGEITTLSRSLRASSARRAAGPPFRVILGRQTRITDDRDEAARSMKPLIGYQLRRFGVDRFAAAGVEVDIPDEPVALADGTDLGHPREARRAHDRTDRWVPDELARWFLDHHCLAGAPADIVDQLEGLRTAGVDEVTINHGESFSIPDELMTTFGATVLPALSGARSAPTGSGSRA